MYYNTTYKAFVAEAAAKTAARLAEQFGIDNLKEDMYTERIAIASVNVAKALAEKLQEFWRQEGDRETVFFDPQDTPMSGIETELSYIAEAISDIKEVKDAADDEQ